MAQFITFRKKKSILAGITIPLPTLIFQMSIDANLPFQTWFLLRTDEAGRS